MSLVDFESQCRFDENFSDSNCDSVESWKQMVDPQFQKFCSDGFLCKDDGFCREVVLLRDSVSLQSLVGKNLLRDDEFVDTKDVRLIRCVDYLVTEISLVEVNLKSNYSNGSVLLGVIDHLPKGVDLLIGNDLDPNSTISSVNVITRSQSKKLQQDASNIVSDNTADYNDNLSNIANVDVSILNTKVEQETDLDLPICSQMKLC